MSDHRLSDTEGTSEAGASFDTRGTSDTGLYGTPQATGWSYPEAIGSTGSDESPDADAGDDHDEISEDAQSPDGAAKGMRQSYLLRRFWRSAAGFWGWGNYSAWPLSGGTGSAAFVSSA
jgi:hypothetical protein